MLSSSKELVRESWEKRMSMGEVPSAGEVPTVGEIPSAGYALRSQMHVHMGRVEACAAISTFYERAASGIGAPGAPCSGEGVGDVAFSRTAELDGCLGGTGYPNRAARHEERG